MSEQILEHLFDSPVKVKLLKLFLRNPDRYFSLDEIISKTQADSRLVRRQVKNLEGIHLLKFKKVKTDRKKNIKGGIYFAVNQNFVFFNELRTLVLKSSPASKEKMLKKIIKLGRIRLALISGILLDFESAGRVDLFVVGDDIKENKLRKFLEEMEAEMGKEIQYASMETKEFEYRFHMFDRFVHDILEKPHEKLINKIRFIE